MIYKVFITIEQMDEDEDESTTEVFNTEVDTFNTLDDAEAFVESLEYNA
jgi:hypothetical protein